MEDSSSTDDGEGDGFRMILIRSKQPRSSHAQFTVGFMLLVESNAGADLNRRLRSSGGEWLQTQMELRLLTHCSPPAVRPRS